MALLWAWEKDGELLASLATTYPHRLQQVDITGDPALHARYHLTIPVVRVGDVELEAPLQRQQLAAALRTVCDR